MFSEILSLGFSFFTGLLLGGSVYGLSKLMDNTISINSKKQLIKTNEKVYTVGNQYIFNNLLVISPTVYAIIDYSILKHELSFSMYNFLALILIQNIGYFFAHKEMHRNNKLYWMHNFHHKFDKLTIPSTGNAVTHAEFIFAYIIPISCGALIIKPNEFEFLSSIGTISLFNLLIHTQELYTLWWIPGLISPTIHIDHHKHRKPHYAAPLIDIDMIMGNNEDSSHEIINNNL